MRKAEVLISELAKCKRLLVEQRETRDFDVVEIKRKAFSGCLGD